MREPPNRLRRLLFIVIILLTLLIAAIGIVKVVRPDLNLLDMIGIGSDAIETVRTEPYWSQLTNKQRESLIPLEKQWDQIPVHQKKKWLAIAKRMEKMSAKEKSRLQERIRVWINLTPQERKEARQNYLNAEKLGVKDKLFQWLEYQKLPEAEKKKFVAKARRKRRIPEPPPPVEKVAPPPPPPVEKVEPPVKEEEPEYWR